MGTQRWGNKKKERNENCIRHLNGKTNRKTLCNPFQLPWLLLLLLLLLFPLTFTVRQLSSAHHCLELGVDLRLETGDRRLKTRDSRRVCTLILCFIWSNQSFAKQPKETTTSRRGRNFCLGICLSHLMILFSLFFFLFVALISLYFFLCSKTFSRIFCVLRGLNRNFCGIYTFAFGFDWFSLGFSLCVFRYYFWLSLCLILCGGEKKVKTAPRAGVVVGQLNRFDCCPFIYVFLRKSKKRKKHNFLFAPFSGKSQRSVQSI